MTDARRYIHNTKTGCHMREQCVGVWTGSQLQTFQNVFVEQKFSEFRPLRGRIMPEPCTGKSVLYSHTPFTHLQ